MLRYITIAAVVVSVATLSTTAFAQSYYRSGSSDSYSSGSSSSSGTHYTSGYYRSNGTYVQGYNSTNPNGTTSDNWSTKGNTNPYTGKEGTRNAW